jgi:peptidylprolyl isomerase
MAKKEQYKLENEEFMRKLRADSAAGLKELPGGVLYKVERSGSASGRKPGKQSVVTCHYTGRLISGRMFDDSRRRGHPEAFRVRELIFGFQVALLNMRPGDRWTVYIPHTAGYGSRSAGDIPACSTLIFDIELISVS